MFAGLPYKKKNQFLIAATVLLLFIVYSLAVKKTVLLRSECKEMESTLEMAADAPVKAAMVQKKLNEMNALLGKDREGQGENAQGDLLGIVTGYCQKNNTLLKEFPKAIISEEKDFVVETNIFTVEGSFAKLLELVYLLEQKSKIGKIASVQFKTRVDVKTKISFLTAKVYFQNARRSEQ